VLDVSSVVITSLALLRYFVGTDQVASVE
jgi:hypothetical protein